MNKVKMNIELTGFDEVTLEDKKVIFNNIRI